MKRETAMAAARSYLADCIELKAMPAKEVEHLPLYYFSNHCHEYHFFNYRCSWQPDGVGNSFWIAVSKKTGLVGGMGEVGE